MAERKVDRIDNNSNCGAWCRMYAYWKRDSIIIFNLIAGHNPSTGIMNMRPERSILCKISPITTTHDRYKWIVLLVQYVFQVDKQKKQIGLPRNSSASEQIVSQVHVQLIHLIIIIICPKKVVNSSEEIDSEDTQELLDNIRRVIGHHSFTRLNAQHSTAHTICSRFMLHFVCFGSWTSHHIWLINTMTSHDDLMKSFWLTTIWIGARVDSQSGPNSSKRIYYEPAICVRDEMRGHYYSGLAQLHFCVFFFSIRMGDVAVGVVGVVVGVVQALSQFIQMACHATYSSIQNALQHCNQVAGKTSAVALIWARLNCPRCEQYSIEYGRLVVRSAINRSIRHIFEWRWKDLDFTVSYDIGIDLFFMPTKWRMGKSHHWLHGWSVHTDKTTLNIKQSFSPSLAELAERPMRREAHYSAIYHPLDCDECEKMGDKIIFRHVVRT